MRGGAGVLGSPIFLDIPKQYSCNSSPKPKSQTLNPELYATGAQVENSRCKGPVRAVARNLPTAGQRDPLSLLDVIVSAGLNNFWVAVQELKLSYQNGYIYIYIYIYGN